MNVSLSDWVDLKSLISLPRYNRAALNWADGQWGGAMQRIFASPLVSKVVPHENYSSKPIVSLFDLDQQHHCFDEDPHYWAKFHEPQITGGFVHHLDEGAFDQQLGRALAFYRACCVCAGLEYRKIRLEDVADFEILAEESTAKAGEGRGRKRVERGKIDILVHFELENRQNAGAALEAKFDHRLTPGQLEKYTDHLKGERKWDLSVSPLILVGRRPSLLAYDQLWRSVTWWRFLATFEREISGTDDAAFRRFRRTIWDTAYG